MSDGTVDPQIKLGVTMNAQTSAGRDKVIADVNQARDATTAANASVTASTQEAAAAEARAAEVAQEYSVSIEVARAALSRLGAASATVAIGSDELEESLGTVQAQMARNQAIADHFGTSLDVVAKAQQILSQEAKGLTVTEEMLGAAIAAADEEIATGNAAVESRIAINKDGITAQMAAIEATDAQAASQTALTGTSDAVTAALGRLAIAQADVAAMATKMGVSQEIAARAMIQIKQAQIADEVARVRTEIEALTTATDDEAVSTDVATAATNVHSESLARNAIMYHRASDGAIDLALGGRRAIQGIADLQFVMLQLFPQFAALIGGAAAFAIIGELWERMTDKMGRDSKKASDDTKSAWEVADATFKTSLEQISKANPYDDLLAKSKQFTEELTLQENTANSLQAALDRLDDAKFGQAESALNLKEQQELQGKSGEEAQGIHLKYDKLRDDLRSDHEKAKAARELDDQKTKLAQLQDQAASIQAQVNAAGIDVQRAHEATQSGTTGASLGQSDYQYNRDRLAFLNRKLKERGQIDPEISPDVSDGAVGTKSVVIPALTEDEAAERIARQQADSQLHQDEQQKGPQYTQSIDRLKKQREDLEKQAGKESADAQTGAYDVAPGQTQEQAQAAAVAAVDAKYKQLFDAIDSQIAAFTKTQDGYAAVNKALEESTKAYQEGQKKLEENAGEQNVIKTNLKTAGYHIETAATAGSATSQKDANAQQQFDSKQAYDKREADRIARGESPKKVVDDPTSSADAKALAKSLLDQIDAEGKKDQLDNAGALGLSTVDRAKLRAELGLDEAKATDVVVAQNQKDQKATSKADDKDLRQKIESAEGQIEATGQKSLLQAMHRFLDKFRGQTGDDAQKQELAGLINILADKQQAMGVDLRELKAKVERRNY